MEGTKIICTTRSQLPLCLSILHTTGVDDVTVSTFEPEDNDYEFWFCISVYHDIPECAVRLINLTRAGYFQKEE